VTAYQEAVRLVDIRYASGLSAYFEVLEAQQQLFPAEIGLAQMRRDQLVAMVNLYRALGGGWQAEERAAGNRTREGRDTGGCAAATPSREFAKSHDL